MTDIKEQLKKIHEESFKIEVKVEENGKMPMKARKSDAGFDLYATEDFNLYPGTVVKHPLNIRLKLPKGTWAEIATKSGLGSKGQLVYAGVIDEEYRGIPHVIMTNLKLNNVQVNGNTVTLTRQKIMLTEVVENKEPISFKKGDKIAQLIMNPYNSEYYMEEVQDVDTNTSRGEGGFGSTGR